MRFLFFLFFLVACNAQEENPKVEILSTKLPLKVLLSSSKKDSTKTKIFIPLEFRVTSHSSNINVSSIRFSESGGNIYGSRGTEIYNYNENGLEIATIKDKLSKNKIFKFYIGYFNTVSNSEKIDITTNYKKTGTKYKNDIYDIKFNDSINYVLKKKIADSIRGYIHLNYTNPKTNQFDYLNIPVKF